MLIETGALLRLPLRALALRAPPGATLRRFHYGCRYAADRYIETTANNVSELQTSGD